MENLFVFEHPLIQHKIGLMRNISTNTKEFRELASEVSMLMGYEVTRNLPLKEVEIDTPLGRTKVKVLEGKKLALCPILRAGLGMVDGMLRLVPLARVGHVGVYRDPVSLKPVEYYFKMPEGNDREVIVLDPMLATGGSAVATIDFLKERGFKNIKFMCLIAAPDGVKNLHAAHKEVPIFCASLDEKLNEHAYILPGLGDAGDRLFGTK